MVEADISLKKNVSMYSLKKENIEVALEVLEYVLCVQKLLFGSFLP